MKNDEFFKHFQISSQKWSILQAYVHIKTDDVGDKQALKMHEINVNRVRPKKIISLLKNWGAPWDGDRFSLSLGEGNGAKTAVFEKRKPLSLG